MNNMYASGEARKLIDSGFTGNGCGSGTISHALCIIVCKILDADPDKLVWVWLIHDAEFSLSRTLKTLSRQSTANNNLYLNLLTSLNSTTQLNVKLCKLMQTALIWGSNSAYWDNKRSVTPITVIILAILVNLALRYFT